jgi:hypothetical protein
MTGRGNALGLRVSSDRPQVLAVVNGSLRLDTEVHAVPVAYVRPWQQSSLFTPG